MNIKWLTFQYLQHFATFLKSKIFPDPLLKENEQFRNCHYGQRGFILGSGHSINEQDLTMLKDEIVITQNHFHAHKDINLINPNYHVLVPKYQPKDFDQDWSAWFESMDERLPKSAKLFLDKNTKYLIDDLNLFNERSFFIKTGYSNIVNKVAPVDITKPIYSVPTVLTECLAIAIHMGFSEIYLLGMDLDQIVQLYQGGDRNNIRFYGSSPITRNSCERDAEIFLAQSGADWFSLWTIWNQCSLLKKVAEARNIKIINATKGGLLNVFDRCNYEDILR
jgi:hypothetical protein